MFEFIKKYINIASVIILIILGITSYSLYRSNEILKKDLSVSKSNEKAFASENSELKDQSRVYQFTVDQLNYFKDSIMIKMNDVRKELKIKDGNLKQLQYILSQAERNDTIVMKDTLFINPKLNMDTTIGDQWYKLRLGLKYPGTVIVNPKFISEKYIITSSKKETVDPPKKFFLLRWFQKKQTVLEVQVVEKNPYIENKQQKFIEILK